MKKLAVLLYGVLSYVLTLGTLTYLMGFTGNILVPKGVDSGVLTSPYQAIVIDLLLIGLFALQHSVMARPWFKKWWTKYIPEPIERSTYCIFTCLVLITLYILWQPLGGVIWMVDNPFIYGALMALYALGWTTVLISSFLINHFDLFGLRQTWLYFRGQPYTPVEFKVPFLYKWVRHPLYFGLLLAFWAAPVMTITRLFFAIMFSAYILKAIQWEEKDLVAFLGEKYRTYKKQVPMLLPSLFSKKEQAPVYETIAKGE